MMPKQKESEIIMNTYFITETQNAYGDREPVKIEAKDLTSAKRKANNVQAFHGTWLHVEDSEKNHISRKNPHTKKWEDTQY